MIDLIVKQAKQFLARPFLMWEYTAKRKLLVIVFFVVISFAFVLIYKPFTFSQLSQAELYAVMLNHAFVTIIVLSLFYFVIPLGFRGYFNDENRTIGRQLIWAIGLLLSATIGHALVNNSFADFPIITLITSAGFTLGISLLPVLVWLFLAIHRMSTENPANQLIKLSANVGHDKITVLLKDLLYIKSLSNYCEVYFIGDDGLKMRMLRIPLSALETQLNSEYCIRCHRSYIVNLFNLIKIEGNVNGSRIYQRAHDQMIPISKSKREEVMDRLKALPISHIS